MVDRYPAGSARMETTRPPRFLGDPGSHLPRSQTPAGPNAPGVYRHVGAAPAFVTTRAPTTSAVFGALPRGFCDRCLRFAAWVAPGISRKARFRLLATLYRMGLVTHRVTMKGFRTYIGSSPLPRLCLAQAEAARPEILSLDHPPAAYTDGVIHRVGS